MAVHKVCLYQLFSVGLEKAYSHIICSSGNLKIMVQFCIRMGVLLATSGENENELQLGKVGQSFSCCIEKKNC